MNVEGLASSRQDVTLYQVFKNRPALPSAKCQVPSAHATFTWEEADVTAWGIKAEISVSCQVQGFIPYHIHRMVPNIDEAET